MAAAGHQSQKSAASGNKSQSKKTEDSWGFQFRVGDGVWVFDEKYAFVRGTIVEIEEKKNSDTKIYQVQVGPGDVREVSNDNSELKKGTTKTAKTTWKNAVDIPGILPATFRSQQSDTHNSREDTSVADMDQLPLLHEASVLENLEKRFLDDRIYTACGPVLIALNPFKWMQSLYSQGLMYHTHEAHTVELSPHPFTQAEMALRKVGADDADSSIVICGESGAGKTETTKLMLKYLSGVACSEDTRDLADRILQSNPLLEAFGNAQTIRNDNSSRFGKFVRMFFTRTTSEGTIASSPSLCGAHIQNYLLEKSRCVFQQYSECNFHIFYQLLEGGSLNLLRDLRLDTVTNFNYVNSFSKRSEDISVGQYHNEAAFNQTCQALSSMDFSLEQQQQFWEVLAGILHLGNLQFRAHNNEHVSVVEAQWRAEINADEDTPILTNTESITVCADLLRIPADSLYFALLTRKIKTGDGEIRTPLREAAAKGGRDALAKSLFVQMFEFVVEQVNKNLKPTNMTNIDNTYGNRFIGILDIYGFERLESNGLDQLFINYANEKLQSLFNMAIFESEKKIYREENIDIAVPEGPDNAECVDLFDGKRGIFALMHEECLLGDQGSDENLCKKFVKFLGSSSYFKQPRPSRNNSEGFVIFHFAGPVQYECADFVERNRDTLQDQIKELLSKSEHPLVSSWYADFRPSQKDRNAAPKRQALQATVADRFKSEMKSLVDTINMTNVEFARCIKTNKRMSPGFVDRLSVLEQLVNSGVVAALTTRRAGYPSRFQFRQFLLRYRVLLFKVGIDPASTNSKDDKRCKDLLNSNTVLDYGINQAMYCMGLSKVFLKAEAVAMLDVAVTRVLSSYATVIQSQFRCYYWRTWLLRVRRKFSRLQAYYRGARERREYSRVIVLMQVRSEMKRLLYESSVFLRDNRGRLEEAKEDRRIASNLSLQQHIAEVQELLEQLESLGEETKSILQKHPADILVEKSLNTQREKSKAVCNSLGYSFTNAQRQMSTFLSVYEDFLETYDFYSKIMGKSLEVLDKAKEAISEWRDQFFCVGVVFPNPPHNSQNSEDWLSFLEELRATYGADSIIVPPCETIARSCREIIAKSHSNTSPWDELAKSLKREIERNNDAVRNGSDLIKTDTKVRASLLRLFHVSIVLLNAVESSLKQVNQRVEKISAEIIPLFMRHLPEIEPLSALQRVHSALRNSLERLWGEAFPCAELDTRIRSIFSMFSSMLDADVNDYQLLKTELFGSHGKGLPNLAVVTNAQLEELVKKFRGDSLRTIYSKAYAELTRDKGEADTTNIWRISLDFIGFDELDAADNGCSESVSDFLNSDVFAVMHSVVSCNRSCMACESAEQNSRIILQGVHDNLESSCNTLSQSVEEFSDKASQITARVAEAKSVLHRGKIDLGSIIDAEATRRRDSEQQAVTALHSEQTSASTTLQQVLEAYPYSDSNREYIANLVSVLSSRQVGHEDMAHWLYSFGAEGKNEKGYHLALRLFSCIHHLGTTITQFLSSRNDDALRALNEYFSELGRIVPAALGVHRDLRRLHASSQSSTERLREACEEKVSRLFDWPGRLRQLGQSLPSHQAKCLWGFLLAKDFASLQDSFHLGTVTKMHPLEDNQCPIVELEIACRHAIPYCNILRKQTMDSLMEQAEKHASSFYRALQELASDVESAETARREHRQQLQELLSRFESLQTSVFNIERLLDSPFNNQGEIFRRTYRGSLQGAMEVCALLNLNSSSLAGENTGLESKELKRIETCLSKTLNILRNDMSHFEELREETRAEHDVNWLTDYLSDSDTDSTYSTESEEPDGEQELLSAPNRSANEEDSPNGASSHYIVSMIDVFENMYDACKDGVVSETGYFPDYFRMKLNTKLFGVVAGVASPSQIYECFERFQRNLQVLETLVKTCEEDIQRSLEDASHLQELLAPMMEDPDKLLIDTSSVYREPLILYRRPQENRAFQGYLGGVRSYLCSVQNVLTRRSGVVEDAAEVHVPKSVANTFAAIWYGFGPDRPILLAGEAAKEMKRIVRKKMRFLLRAIHHGSIRFQGVPANRKPVDERSLRKKRKFDRLQKLLRPIQTRDIPFLRNNGDPLGIMLSMMEDWSRKEEAKEQSNEAMGLAKHCMQLQFQNAVPISGTMSSEFDALCPAADSAFSKENIKKISVSYELCDSNSVKECSHDSTFFMTLELFHIKRITSSLADIVCSLYNEHSSVEQRTRARIDEVIDECNTELFTLSETPELNEKDIRRLHDAINDLQERYGYLRDTVLELLNAQEAEKRRRVEHIIQSSCTEMDMLARRLTSLVASLTSDETTEVTPAVLNETELISSLSTSIRETSELLNKSWERSCLLEGISCVESVEFSLNRCKEIVTGVLERTEYKYSGDMKELYSPLIQRNPSSLGFVRRVQTLKSSMGNSESVLERSESYRKQNQESINGKVEWLRVIHGKLDSALWNSNQAIGTLQTLHQQLMREHDARRLSQRSHQNTEFHQTLPLPPQVHSCNQPGSEGAHTSSSKSLSPGSPNREDNAREVDVPLTQFNLEEKTRRSRSSCSPQSLVYVMEKYRQYYGDPLDFSHKNCKHRPK
eukprot:gb/GECG01008925.1/.p1 GENE.gb/GECG01008925.1/~~gb/GECG01008925.1/.p1  ORF type:complete len:2582 (+),score=329.85 gb/GECG01008925.1/:1-7746(+)